MAALLPDANIIAKPVTRTLLMVGGSPSGFRAMWSLAAEQLAALHMRPRAVAPALIRQRFGLQLTPSGDRQILADAVAATDTTVAGLCPECR